MPSSPNLLKADIHNYIRYVRLLSSSSLLLLLIIIACGCTQPDQPVYHYKKRQEPSIAEKSGNSSKRAALAFSPDGKLVVVSGRYLLRLWDIQNAKPVCSLKSGNNSTQNSTVNYMPAPMNSFRVGFTRDGVPYYGDYEKEVFCDKHTGEIIKELSVTAGKNNDGTQIISPFILSQDASRQIIGYNDKSYTSFQVKDPNTGRIYSTITAKHFIEINSINCSQNGKYLLYPLDDSQLAVVDTDTGAQIRKYTHEPIVNGDTYTSYRTTTVRSFVCVSPDSKYAGISRTSTLLPIPDSSRPVDPNAVVDYTSSNSSLVIYSKDSVKPIFHLTLSGLIINVVFAPDNKSFAVLYNGKALIYDLKTLKVIRTLLSDNEPIMAIAFSLDNNKIATVDGKCTLKIWDAKTGKETLSLER